MALRLSTFFIFAAIGCAQGAPAPIPAQKATRSAAERKISPLLLEEISRRRSEQAQKTVNPASPRSTLVKIDEKGRALVDIRAAVSAALLARVKELDGIVVSSSPEYDSTLAWIPLLELERLAADATVRGIEPAIDPMLNSIQR